ncbi:hypothetical protein FA10DRAFT_288665 [Acaromyces ingoldii]|uniref:Phytanoyl-CoA dioxygenase n=1 Tax=Acaromyces ingoldii TaxID=215250 RepID=A0A316YFL2_9BASI|nr:hypothetical protein FA10DRAFT_288665 [Acaromyces ingoldii]PWN87972.1 hypothetical protein FA10DRAFT_288665 [Acaromyces ingoldii]
MAANTITSIKPDGQEKRHGRLNQRHVQAALEALHRDGIVAVKDVVDGDAIDTLNARMVRDTRILVDRGDEGPFNYNLGNLQQSPPYEVVSFHPSIFFNPIAAQLTSAFLGGRPTLSFISSNAAVRAEHGQPVHCDADFDHPQIPFAAVVNVGLVDMEPANGSTEVWLGSHRGTTVADQEGAHGERASGRILEGLLAARRRVSPPLQPTFKKGSILIRDLRLWHAGMPNRTDEVRIMLAMIHFAPWYRQRMALLLPEALRGPVMAQQAQGVDVAATFTTDPIDHLNAGYGNSFDLGQEQ